jgi:hypothetical protein
MVGIVVLYVHMNSRLKLKKPSRLEWIILAIIGATIAALGLWWVVSSVIDSQKTYPLGNKLEYVGKEESRCPSGFTPEGFKFGFCEKTATYYYATDMNLSEVRQYFRNTRIQSSYKDGLDVIPLDSPSPMCGLTVHNTSFVINNSNFAINVTYADDLKTAANRISLKKSSKKHVVTIYSGDYKYLLQYAL